MSIWNKNFSIEPVLPSYIEALSIQCFAVLEINILQNLALLEVTESTHAYRRPGTKIL